MIDKSPCMKNLKDPNFGALNKQQHVPLQELTRPHIDSFNYMLREGLSAAVKSIPPVEFALPNKQRIKLSLSDASIHSPTVPKTNIYSVVNKVYPSECREGGTSYKGGLVLHMSWAVDGVTMASEDHHVGEVPIMIKSAACNIGKMGPADLVAHGEEAEEMGGYFIVNGNEKVVRMLIMPRANYPTALSRASWKNRGPQYTEFGVSLRSVKPDRTTSNIVLHYLTNGSATLCFVHRKEQFFVPIIFILKALVDTTDQHIFSEMTKGLEDDSYYKGCVANMLRAAREEKLCDQREIQEFIGKTFRVRTDLPEWYTDKEVTAYLLRHAICINLSSNLDKFNMLVMMMRKLYTFASGSCCAESADNPMFQEVLLPGHLYQVLLREKIEDWLISIKMFIDRAARRKLELFKLDQSVMNSAISKALDISKSMDYFLATGNVITRTGLGLMQFSGLTIVADKLNFLRYLSHFRCIHRGAFFAQMRTTGVRKLLPEAWGFMCPVHTPDGTPCGLMNHLSAACQIQNTTFRSSHLPALLCDFGMTPYDLDPPCAVSACYQVMLDGRMVGWVPQTLAENLVSQLRVMKVKGINNVPRTLEICFVRTRPVAAQHPGIYLFSTIARMLRPVRNLALDAVEMVGTFEQVYLDVCVIPEEAHEGKTTHQELSEFAMLSTVASLTPFSDFNQSPRNMYQCQMGKQTMGFPLHAWSHRADNKLYRLQTPQSPMVRPYMHDHYDIDNYPLGTNAVVAVISYTGYDMEDAFILSKGTFDRGFGHGTVYKSQFIDLKDVSKERGKVSLIFGYKETKEHGNSLDPDGLPPVGTLLKNGDPFYSYINLHTGQQRVVTYSNQEPGFVDNIKICGHRTGNDHMSRVCVVLRIQRNPIIGDKFSSRHGQKGICSQIWPVEDMPFTESGMTPDILFNPHGYPSRMTIGMMIESMAGKSASMHALPVDATPFTFSEEEPAIDYMGRMLNAAGYNYHGTERMYNGLDGREFEADIFIGVVYYQRLRHMVSDKFQVRTTGPVDQVTHQPVKGRKRGGGVRFGEMERDALLAHGTSFLLNDRLLNCSDECRAYVCQQCGSLLSPYKERPANKNAAATSEAVQAWRCSVCDRSDSIQLIRIPYVFRYLVAELAAMNIKAKLQIKAI